MDPLQLYTTLKIIHVFFIISWCAGLFYLPRILVNLALDTQPDVQLRLIIMAQKLFRFSCLIALVAIISGGALWYTLGKLGPWIHIKVTLVLALVFCQVWIYYLIQNFIKAQNKKSHQWFRWFNEVPTVIILLVVILVIAKPFSS